MAKHIAWEERVIAPERSCGTASAQRSRKAERTNGVGIPRMGRFGQGARTQRLRVGPKAEREKAACGSLLPTAWGSALLTYCYDLALTLNKSHTSGEESINQCSWMLHFVGGM
ncbi:uncharacterized protein ACIB01_006265 isoform 2-T2 [Guaruba guarouba]